VESGNTGQQFYTERLTRWAKHLNWAQLPSHSLLDPPMVDMTELNGGA
jgi:hypothetical protein